MEAASWKFDPSSLGAYSEPALQRIVSFVRPHEIGIFYAVRPLEAIRKEADRNSAAPSADLGSAIAPC